MKKVEDYIRTIPDFPVPGIMFRDVTTVFGDAEGFKLAVEEMIKCLDGVEFDAVAGAESRGFVLGSAIACSMGKPFILIRKKGKLPCDTIEETYALEYGMETIEIHKDSVKPGQKIVVVDDLIATGGTMLASCHLIERLGGKIAKCLLLIELAGLKGRECLKDYDVSSVVVYEGK